MTRSIGNRAVGIILMAACSVGLSAALDVGMFGAGMMLLGFAGLCLYLEEIRRECIAELEADLGNLKVLLKSLRYHVQGTSGAEAEEPEEQE
jgi:hypothetical protein